MTTHHEFQLKSEPAAREGKVKPNFNATIFGELEHKLRGSPWNSGASEAHGLLAALACCGIQPGEIRAKSWLFNLDEEPHRDIIEGLYALVCRELDDPEFSFSLLLPDEESTLAQRAEAVSDWCQGFLQGIYHGDGVLPQGAGAQTREAVNDIREIGHLEPDPNDPEGSERDLAEVVEFLRVAVLLIREELQPRSPGATPASELN